MVKTVEGMIREAAMTEPTEEARLKSYERWMGILNKKREEFATLPKNSAMRSAVNNLVREDLALEGIAGLKGNTTWQSGAWGSTRPGAAVTASESRYRQFGNTVRTLHTQEYWKQLQVWRAETRGCWWTLALKRRSSPALLLLFGSRKRSKPPGTRRCRKGLRPRRRQ